MVRYSLLRYDELTDFKEVNPMTDKNIHQLAVITGGASGIGLSAVKRFLNEGYKVLILDANKDAGEEAVKNLKSDTCDVNFHTL